MNNRQLITVLVALGLVGVGVVWKFKSGQAPTSGREVEKLDRVLPDFALNDVTGIQIKNKKEEVNLAFAGDTWGVKERDGYPANYDFIKELVTKVHDLKVIDQPQAIGQSQLGRLQLISPASENAKEAKDEEVGTLLVFKKEGDQEVGRLVLGKTIESQPTEENPFFNMGASNGRFAQAGSKTDIYYKIKEAFTSLNVEARGWLDKQFIAPSGGLKSIEVKVTEPADQSWKVDKEKEGADPVLAEKKEGEEIDQERVKQAGSAFSSAYFSDVAVSADKEKTGLEAPQRTAAVSFFDGFTYQINVGSKVKPDDENSDYYIGLTVAYTPVPEPSAPAAEPVPPEPQASPVPEGETEEQKKEREKKDADARAAWEIARQNIEATKAKHEADKKQWEDDKKKKEERLAKEKAFEGRTYIVSKYTVDWFLKDRSYFKKAPAAAAPAATTGVASPPVTVPTAPTPQRIEAVTPPIKVELPQPKEAEKPEVKPQEAPPPPQPELPQAPDASDAPAPAEQEEAQPEPAPAPEEPAAEQPPPNP